MLTPHLPAILRCDDNDDVDAAVAVAAPLLDDKILANEDVRDKVFVWLCCVDGEDGVANAAAAAAGNGDGFVVVDDGKNSLFNKAIIMRSNRVVVFACVHKQTGYISMNVMAV